MTTWSISASAPLAKGHVRQDLGGGATTGRSGLIEASPVSMPTFSAPRSPHSAKNFSQTSALTGAV